LYAVLPTYRDTWSVMDTQEVMAQVRVLSPRPILITLSGGNPAIQPLGDLVDLAHAQGDTVCMETQGSIARAWMRRLDVLTLSPKPPSSGMTTHWGRLDACCAIPAARVVLKVVVFDEADYAYAHTVAARYPSLPLYLQPGNATPPQAGAFDLDGVLDKTRWLVEQVTTEQWNGVTVLPQLHTLLWQNTRGV
jgi:7-carboxy-7-deazaguanine synthase